MSPVAFGAELPDRAEVSTLENHRQESERVPYGVEKSQEKPQISLGPSHYEKDRSDELMKLANAEEERIARELEEKCLREEVVEIRDSSVNPSAMIRDDRGDVTGTASEIPAIQREESSENHTNSDLDRKYRTNNRLPAETNIRILINLPIARSL
eukprot:TRINITY_DN9311_c0_g1_i1.p1 TRINITY_DN9311_c0_g1~~TRINITY_DN9311_c0_g1_i1.p1  ORF type:complete len:155 (+),score=35.20 TRINITY_DN9311_c0_g1_i1:1450-1914(+)